jgi:hypothetical protein
MRSVAESSKKDSMAISFCCSAALRAVGGICTKLSGLRTFRSMCPRYDKCQQAEWDGTNVRLARGGWGSGDVGWVKGIVYGALQMRAMSMMRVRVRVCVCVCVCSGAGGSVVVSSSSFIIYCTHARTHAACTCSCTGTHTRTDSDVRILIVGVVVDRWSMFISMFRCLFLYQTSDLGSSPAQPKVNFPSPLSSCRSKPLVSAQYSDIRIPGKAKGSRNGGSLR